jgi:serine/threonine-protein kinase
MVQAPDAGPETPFAGRYRLIEVIGRGGLGTVYRAEDLLNGGQVALKLIRRDAASGSENARFLQELQLNAPLTHPHIVPSLDSGDTGDGLFYTMPFIEGESLRERLRREPQLPVQEAVQILRALAGALDHAHRQGIIHRDITPENVLLATDPAGGVPHPWLAGFGIAQALEAAGGGQLTRTGASFGTPAYMSPEQANPSGRLDGRSDVYALGCVAYEMLAGTPPFTGPTAEAILARHVADPPPPLRTVRRTLPEPVAAAIGRALAKAPADRFAAAGEFARALTTDPEAAPRPWRSDGRRRVLLTGLAILVLALVASATLLVRESTAPAVLPSASRIAVLPFLSPARDTGLTRLGRDLATTIAASLEGIGGIEVADRLAIASGTAGRNDLSAAEETALARRLGARSVVRGTLVQAGDRVRLDLGLFRVEGGASIADRLSVTADRDSVRLLTDSASLALLRGVWRRGEPPSPSLEAVTTRSLPALRAFLDGERALAANRWEEAALAFGSAVAADSTFPLARFRHALTRYWTGWEGDEFDAAPLRHRLHLLPERERLVIVPMIDSMSLEERIGRFRAVTRRYPRYWPGWFLYGDLLYHYGPNLGHDWTEPVEAFQRVVELNPRLIPAWEHLYLQVSWAGHVGEPRALGELMQLGWTDYLDPFRRLERGIVAAGGTIPSELDPLADSLALLMATAPATLIERGYGDAAFRLLRGWSPTAQLDLNQRAIRFAAAGAEKRVRIPIAASNAWSWAARGRWDSALTLMAAVALEHPGVIGRPRFSAPRFPPVGGPVLAIESYGMAVIAGWLGATRSDLADERRPHALAAIEDLGDEESKLDARGRIAWFDGLQGYATRSREAIRLARGQAGRSGYRQAAQVDRSLAAFERALAGDRAGAGRELASGELHCVNATQAHSFLSEANSCNSFTPHLAIQRLAAAQWLQEAGELELATRLLRYQDAAIWMGWLWSFHDALAGPTHLLRARLEEQRGDPARARDHYRQFLRIYDQPMPSSAHLVEEARNALARLSGED